MNTSVTSRTDPRAVDVSFGADTLVVTLADGRIVSTPLEWFPKLLSADESARKDWRLIGNGVGIHWEQLDEDLSVQGLLAA